MAIDLTQNLGGGGMYPYLPFMVSRPGIASDSAGVMERGAGALLRRTQPRMAGTRVTRDGRLVGIGPTRRDHAFERPLMVFAVKVRCIGLICQ